MATENHTKVYICIYFFYLEQSTVFTTYYIDKSCGCGKDLKKNTIFGHGGYMLPEHFEHFLSIGKEWPSYHNLLRLPKQI